MKKNNKKRNLTLVKSKIAKLENPQMVKGGNYNLETNTETFGLSESSKKCLTEFIDTEIQSTVTSPIGTFM